MRFLKFRLNERMKKRTKSSKKPKPKIIRPSHDAILRKSLENPALAKEFFDINLPEDLRAIINTSNLTIEKESFVDENLKPNIGDILFSAKCGEENVYIYLLLEHQSKPDPIMAFRLVKYMVNIWARYFSKNPNSASLPLIYPMVFYNGKQKYNVARNLCDLFDNKLFGKRFWHEDYHLINVHEIPDEELKKGSGVGMLEYFMKHIRARDLVKKWEEIAPLLNDVKLTIGKDFIRILAHYTLTSLGENDKMKLDEILTENLSKEDGEDIMGSYAENLAQKNLDIGWNAGLEEGLEQGLEQGLEKGREETMAFVVRHMLKNRMDVGLIAQLTGSSVETVENIVREAIKA